MMLRARNPEVVCSMEVGIKGCDDGNPMLDATKGQSMRQVK